MTEELSQDQIRSQLERILQSPQFCSAEKLRRFLSYVVERSIDGQAAHIKQYTIAVEALGYDEEFNPLEDSIIRIQARRVRWALDEYYHDQGLNDPVLIRLPKGTYAPLFLLNDGLTDPASKRAKDQTPLKDKPILDNPASIAVLPFEFQGDEMTEAYVAEALTDALTVGLSKFESLGVIAGRSTRQFKGSPKSIESIAQILGVRFILTGTIHKNAQRLRVAVQFTDARDEALLWAESMDRDITGSSIFATLDNITRYILTNVGDEHGMILQQLISEIDQKPLADLSCFDTAHLYHAYNTTVGKQQHLRIRDILEHIVAKKPLYALGWSHLAAVYGDVYSLEYAGVDEPLKKALFCAKKAVALDSRSQEGRANLALVRFLRQEHEEAVKEAERAIPINPYSAYVVSFCGFIIGLSGELQRGREIIDEIDAFKPNVPGWVRLIPFLDCLTQQDYHSALEEARRFRMPDEIAWDPICRATAAGHLGDTTVAANAYAELIDKFPEIGAHLDRSIRLYLHFDNWVDLVLTGLNQAEKSWASSTLAPEGKLMAKV